MYGDGAFGGLAVDGGGCDSRGSGICGSYGSIFIDAGDIAVRTGP